MKTTSTQQEILLITGTTFSSREFCENSDGFIYRHLTEKQKLEIACWNGLLPEMFPEIFNQYSEDKKLYLWEVREGASFLELELGEKYEAFDRQFSLDPYSFLPTRILS